MNLDKYHQILKKVWGYENFRPLQYEIILSVAEHRKDTLGLLPTGGGKSIIFQVAALAMNGMALVVTPLIALMEDQVENLQRRGVPAVAVHSGLSREEIELELQRAADGYYKFLYLSPERLASESFLKRLQFFQISLLVVDEAHCISQWGYDFRPSYLKIGEIREYLPDVPVLALTASATPAVIEDIQKHLKFKEPNVFKKSFARDNLVYWVKNTPDKLGALLRLLRKTRGSGIIYVRSRRRTEELAYFLKQNGISADFYHAGLQYKEKERRQNAWKHGKIQVIVATNAFGMGIDKPDVRFVVHTDLPDSLEAYYQEAGRAGRDQKTAYAIVFYNLADIEKLRQSVRINFPPIDTVRRIYAAICNYLQLPIGSGVDESFPINLYEFISRYKFNSYVVLASLRLLQQEGYIEFTDEITQLPRLKFSASRADVYKFQVENKIFDPFIKALLRKYPGIFERFVTINEFYLARMFHVKVELIRKYILKLQQFGIVEYQPFIRANFIYFPHGRLPEKDIVFSKEHYTFLKQRYIDHIESVIAYVENTDKCRQQMILEYFGETDSKPCGKCDVCRAKIRKNS